MDATMDTMKIPTDEKEQTRRARYQRANQSHRLRRNMEADRMLERYGRTCVCCGTADNISVWPLHGTKSELLAKHHVPNRSGNFNRIVLVVLEAPDGFETRCGSCAGRRMAGNPCDPAEHQQADVLLRRMGK